MLTSFRRYLLWRHAFGTFLLLLGVTWAGSAQASYWNDVYQGLDQFSRLPGDVSQLKDSYRQTQQELEHARTSIENYQKQNAQLLEQNQQLTKAVTELKQLQELREQSSHRTKILLWTAVGLLAGYFILIRLIRYGMRRRSRRY